MYFKQLPLLLYTIGGTQKLVTNILTRITVDSTMESSVYVYDEYMVTDGETPESVAYDFYGDPQYHWIIMLCNNIIYPWEQWAVSTDTVNELSLNKYGVENLYSIHHYVNSDGFVVNVGNGAAPVSNYDYEINENDAKRSIKILNPQLLNSFVIQFNSLIQATI